MNLKTLRDYLNSLNLDEVQPDVEIVYHASDGTHCEDMACFNLVSPSDPKFKPYLSISCESFLEHYSEVMENE